MNTSCSYNNQHGFKTIYTESEKEIIVKSVVDLWNKTQTILPKTKIDYLSINVIKTIVEAKDYFGYETITKGFKKVNKSSFLTGFSKSSFKATVGWVCDLDNMSKILNCAYDDSLDNENEKDSETVPTYIKCIYYRIMQDKGFVETDKCGTELKYDEKYIFTDAERKYWEDQGRFINGKFISVPVDEKTPKSNEYWGNIKGA